MQKLHPHSLLWSLLATSTALVGCSSGRTEQTESVYVAPGNASDSSGGGNATPSGDTSSAGTGAAEDTNAADGDNDTSDDVIDLEMGDSNPELVQPGAEDPADGEVEPMPETENPAEAEDPAEGEVEPMPEPDRVVLFDGSNLNAFISRNTGGPVGWQVLGDGTMVVTPGTGDIITRQEFEDVFVHVEYKTPVFPANVTGQARGNSGIYLKSMYEVQVLDSFGRQPEIDGCGSIYGVSPPLTVACFQEEVWNTYEIEFQAPRYDAQGNKLSNARMPLVTLNGVVVQEDVEVPFGTRDGYAESPGPAGIMFQDHGNRIAFRNIWAIPR